MSTVAAPGTPAQGERWRSEPGIPSLLFGVVLPLGAIVFELMTRACADALFDPLPTFFHVMLVALVPAVNLLAWLALTHHNPHPRLLALGNGAAMAIAGFFTVLFLPVMPLGVVAIIFFGLGLLVWAPAFALVVAIMLRLRLRRAAADEGLRHRTWPGFVCGLLMLVALDLPTTLTRMGLRMATADTPTVQMRGIRMLRAVGSEEVLRRLCYVRTGNATDMLSFLFDLRSVSPDEVRKVYYRVTGVPFNTRPAPKNFSRSRRTQLFDDTDFDSDQGTDAVGGRLRKLALVSSRLDGSLDANAALGYVEWTLVLKNDAEIVREGRAQIALPPGAVVSRLTLWINGEEREAAFAARGQVTAAYRSVVTQRRDPVLVTTAGADRIALQMFPVPAHGEMKVRIGMTIPVQQRTLREGVLRMPYFHERNFDIASGLEHSVWIESKTALEGDSSNVRTIAGGGSSLRLALPDDQLGTDKSTVAVTREAGATVWSRDPHTDTDFIRQTLEIVPSVQPSRVVIVVDGSVSMRPSAPQLADAISRLPAQVPIYLVIAGDDEVQEDVVRTNIRDAAAAIREYDFAGGNDNTAALARGLDLAMEASASALIWMHGPQPVLLRTREAIEQRLARGGTRVSWYDVQVAPGVNLIGERLDEFLKIRTLTATDLDELFASWRPDGKQVTAIRTRGTATDVPALVEDQQTSAHLARLWANDEVGRLLYTEHPARESAIEIAHRYQLVTPVTGAVVLETQQQYDAAGLTPVPEGTVPTIPEPEEWALIVIALAILLYAYRRRREARNYALP